MSRDYTAVPHEYLEEMDYLSDAEFGRLIRALLTYSMTGEEKELSGGERAHWKRVRNRENRYQESFENNEKVKTERAKNAANARWSNAQACTSNAKNANACTSIPTPDEAWRLVYRAIRNSTYWAAEEFAKLPEDIQRFVGHPDQLKEWALMEADVVQSVIASNFQRSFKVRQANDRDYAKLPAEVKQFVSRLSESTFGFLEAGNDGSQMPMGTNIPYEEGTL